MYVQSVYFIPVLFFFLHCSHHINESAECSDIRLMKGERVVYVVDSSMLDSLRSFEKEIVKCSS